MVEREKVVEWSPFDEAAEFIKKGKGEKHTIKNLLLKKLRKLCPNL
jgi:hypothetical protein